MNQTELAELRELINHQLEHRDACERCHGERGGVPGNENIVNGVVLCDYCHADDLQRELTMSTTSELQEELAAEVNELMEIANAEIAAGRGPTKESVAAIYMQRHPQASAEQVGCAWFRMLSAMFTTDHFAEDGI